MAPNTTVTTTLPSQEAPTIQPQNDSDKEDSCPKQTQQEYKSVIGTFGGKLKWLNIISITILHAALLWGLISFPYLQNLRLVAYAFFIGGINGLGVTAGAHRLWCHRSYKAKLPLRIILMLCFSLAGQNTLYDWVRDHRVHHRFTETDADPHNSNRGFFFAHVGWLMMHKHSEVLRRGREVNMDDLLADPVVQFHQRHFVLLKVLMSFILPSIIPPLWWGQDWFWSFIAICIGRYALSLNFTWMVNSAAHMWGYKSYNKNIGPTENLTVSIVAMGEGWHNYHHTFPWDYSTGELGKFFNATTFWIHVFEKIGWAYDLKTPSKELVKKVVEKSGDGTHPVWGHVEVPEKTDADLLGSTDNDGTKKDD